MQDHECFSGIFSSCRKVAKKDRGPSPVFLLFKRVHANRPLCSLVSALASRISAELHFAQPASTKKLPSSDPAAPGHLPPGEGKNGGNRKDATPAVVVS